MSRPIPNNWTSRISIMNNTEHRGIPVSKSDDLVAHTATGPQRNKPFSLKAYGIVSLCSAIGFGLGYLLSDALGLNNVLQNAMAMSSMWLGMSIGVFFSVKNTTRVFGRLLLSMSWFSIWGFGVLGGTIPLVLALIFEVSGWPLIFLGALTINTGIVLGFITFFLTIKRTHSRRGTHATDANVPPA